MMIHIFRGPDRVFGFTPEIDGNRLPTQYGPWTAFKSLEMNKGEAQPGVDVDECLADVLAHGFHLTGAHIRITEQALANDR